MSLSTTIESSGGNGGVFMLVVRTYLHYDETPRF